MQKLLIDGHNLIGQTPGLSLADPNDEQKLIVMLRRYAARKQARIVVIFDSGNPGGKSKELSGGRWQKSLAKQSRSASTFVLAQEFFPSYSVSILSGL